MSSDESPALESWIGRTEQVADEATRAPAVALAATLDRDASGLERGDPLAAALALDLLHAQGAGRARSAPTAIRGVAASCRR